MLDEPGILTAVEANPEICANVWWGKRLSAVGVSLDRADAALVEDLLADAWEHKLRPSREAAAPARTSGCRRDR